MLSSSLTRATRVFLSGCLVHLIMIKLSSEPMLEVQGPHSMDHHGWRKENFSHQEEILLDVFPLVWKEYENPYRMGRL